MSICTLINLYPKLFSKIEILVKSSFEILQNQQVDSYNYNFKFLEFKFFYILKY